MGKKLTAILPLYLASIILLAFSVFPHHHHHSYICFNTVHHFSTTDPHHHTHPEIPEKGCNIQYLFQADNIKTLSRYQIQDEPLHNLISPYLITDLLYIPLSASLTAPYPDNGDETPPRQPVISHKLTRGPPCVG
ncbi:DUF6769 family protein [Odoribacter lunatus]|uniref:DUF6769 family protein n=1 Tax=Odoribacter lunatus TaxID=2941335 RepID=UPI00203D0624|nr:DUF6769 family protein [Odoribacter lunatus]